MADQDSLNEEFVVTSTPIGKQKNPKSKGIQHDDDSKENVQYAQYVQDDTQKSDTLGNLTEDRSRSLRNVVIDLSDDSLTFKGKSNQSMHERLMRKEHKKSRIPLSTRTRILNQNRIDSSSERLKTKDEEDLSKSLAAFNLSCGSRKSESFHSISSSFINETRLSSGDKPNRRVLLDTSESEPSFSDADLSKEEEEDDEGEEEGGQVRIVPESPPPITIEDPCESNQDATPSSAEDDSFKSANDNDPSIIVLSPIALPTFARPLVFPSQQSQQQTSKLIRPEFFSIQTTQQDSKIQRENSVMPAQQPSGFPIFGGGIKSQVKVPQRGPQMISPSHMVKANDGKRLFGGKMTTARIGNINTITNEALSSIHKSLATLPDETVRSNTPLGLRVQLMPYQQHGLAWMLWRESQFPPTGILADDMGLGKTIAVISLILQKKNDYLNKIVNPEEEKIRQRFSQNDDHLIKSRASLIVAPASVLMQWDKEIKDRVDGRLRHIVCHGPNRENIADRLARYDIVLTTYGTLTSELDNDYIQSPFTRISWERIILDEAHKIKNRKSKISKVVCYIPGLYRWCLTGTPIHNELWDLYSLIRFMRVSPFNEEAHWKNYIHTGTKGSERLNTLVKGILLRRTKAQIDVVTNKRLVELPDRHYAVVTLKMDDVEEYCYQIMFQASRQKVRKFLQDESWKPSRLKKPSSSTIKNPFLFGKREISTSDRFQAMNYLLVLLLRLRQACVHMYLTRQAIDLDAFKQDGGDECLDKEIVDELERTFNNLSMIDSGQQEEHNRKVEMLFDKSYQTVKIAAVLSHLYKVVEQREKCVVVSQWTSVLSLLEPHLKKRHIRYSSITGQILPKARQIHIDDFNRKNGGAEVLLLSLNAGGVGLNLVGGNHLFIVDLHWNPALENQACDRIYRVGQTKSCHIHKFVVSDTIEGRVMELQQKKTLLANTVLQGAADKNLTKLTVNDLRFLFELDKCGNKAASVPSQAPLC